MQQWKSAPAHQPERHHRLHYCCMKTHHTAHQRLCERVQSCTKKYIRSHCCRWHSQCRIHIFKWLRLTTIAPVLTLICEQHHLWLKTSASQMTQHWQMIPHQRMKMMSPILIVCWADQKHRCMFWQATLRPVCEWYSTWMGNSFHDFFLPQFMF